MEVTILFCHDMLSVGGEKDSGPFQELLMSNPDHTRILNKTNDFN